MLRFLDAPQGGVIYLFPGKTYKIGRKDSEILIENDKSISRNHAIIKITNNKPYLVDCGSKYKTFINNENIAPNVDIELKDGDQIRFGVYNSVYTYRQKDITTCGSGLSEKQKTFLKKVFNKLKGEFLNEWTTNCQYLTTQGIKLTVKVLCAIIDDKPLVTTDFWIELINCIRNSKPPPNPDDFQPPMTEKSIDFKSIIRNRKRNDLFKDKTFVFETYKIKKQMQLVIEKAGGKCISFEKNPLSISDIKNNQTVNYIFINESLSEDPPDRLKEIYDFLKADGKRTIPLSEIALAIVRCNCEKDCNTLFNRANEVFLKGPCVNPGSSLITETQEENDQKIESNTVIPETLDEEYRIITQESCSQPVNIDNAVVCESKESVENNEKSNMIIPETVDEEYKIDIVESCLPEMYTQSQETSITDSAPFSETPLPSVLAPIKTEKRNYSSDENPSSCKKIKKEFNESIKVQNNAGNSTKIVKNPCSIINDGGNETSLKNPETSTGWITSKNQSNKENSFGRLNAVSHSQSPIEKETSIEENNDSYEETKENPNKKIKLDLSSSSRLETQPSSTGWLSKESLHNTIKTEVDPDLQEYCEKFKDKIKITYSNNLLVRKPTVSQHDDTNGKTVLNFKKFKKVQPLFPQSRIIKTHSAPSNLPEETEEPERKKKKSSQDKYYNRSTV